jgi:hypothetical protein
MTALPGVARAPGGVWSRTAGFCRLLLLFVLPPFLFYAMSRSGHGIVGFDFRGTLWDPAKAILHGRNPYPPPHADAILTGNPAAYPPPMMLAVTPLTVLGWTAGIAVWLGIETVGVIAALWLLGVRELPVFALVLASHPFLVALIHGNLTVLLVLGLALAWRSRERPALAGACVAALVVAKLFLWPLFVWLLATRRFRAAAYGAVFTMTATLASWAIIGFDGFRDYASLLRALDHVYSRHSQSLTSLAERAGASEGTAKALALVAGLAVLGIGVALVRRPEGDRRLFSAAVIAAVLSSPIAWLYYYVLLFVPLALYRPRLSRVWLIVPAFWLPFIAQSIGAPKDVCCRPPGMPLPAWQTFTAIPSYQMLIVTMVLVATTALVVLRQANAAYRAKLSGESAGAPSLLK